MFRFALRLRYRLLARLWCWCRRCPRPARTRSRLLETGFGGGHQRGVAEITGVDAFRIRQTARRDLRGNNFNHRLEWRRRAVSLTHAHLAAHALDIAG